MPATDHIDVIQGIHLLASGSVGISITGPGVQGNCLLTSQRLALDTFDQPGLKTSSAPNPQFAITGWLKPAANAVAVYMYYFNTDPDEEYFDFLINFAFAGSFPGRLSVYRNSVGFEEPLEIDDVVPVAGSDWFFFVAQQATFSQFQYSINGGTLQNAGTGIVFPNTSKGLFEIESNSLGGFFGQDVRYDELAIWPNSLTQSQIAVLYNGGVGHTWPVDVGS